MTTRARGATPAPHDRQVRLSVTRAPNGADLTLRMLATLGANTSHALVIEALGQPVPKARARVTSRGAYTPHRSRDAQTILAHAFVDVPFHEGNVALACLFFREDRRRVDLDNLFKLVMDAGTEAGIWLDDSQVTAHAARVELDRAKPRTVIAIGKHVSSLRRAAA